MNQKIEEYLNDCRSGRLQSRSIPVSYPVAWAAPPEMPPPIPPPEFAEAGSGDFEGVADPWFDPDP